MNALKMSYDLGYKDGENSCRDDMAGVMAQRTEVWRWAIECYMKLHGEALAEANASMPDFVRGGVR